MRLIDADALDNIVLRLNEEGRTVTRSEYKTLDSIIFEFPTIEAEPVRRGRWREIKSNDWSGGGAYVCSVCGYGYSWAGYHEANEFTYCPNCGARMEEEG